MICRNTAKWLIVLIIAGLLGPGYAVAMTTVDSFYPDEGSESFYLSGHRSRDDIELLASQDGQEITVTDVAGVTSIGPDCSNVDGQTAVCQRYIGIVLGRLRGGDDELEIAGDIDGLYLAQAGDDRVVDDLGQAEIDGSTGDDRLDGGGDSDRLAGGAGSDSLRGGNGSDRITGNRGSDDLAAGAGNDRVDASDGQRDERIDCGPGSDTARIDRALDPRPRHCERVVRLPR